MLVFSRAISPLAVSKARYSVSSGGGIPLLFKKQLFKRDLGREENFWEH